MIKPAQGEGDFYPSWDDVSFSPAPGIRTDVISGDGLMITRNVIAPGIKVAVNRHEAEQFSYVVSGRLEVEVAGEKKIVGPGEPVYIPGNEWHGGEILDEELVIIEAYAPPRQELLDAAQAHAATDPDD